MFHSLYFLQWFLHFHHILPPIVQVRYDLISFLSTLLLSPSEVFCSIFTPFGISYLTFQVDMEAVVSESCRILSSRNISPATSRMPFHSPRSRHHHSRSHSPIPESGLFQFGCCFFLFDSHFFLYWILSLFEFVFIRFIDVFVVLTFVPFITEFCLY